MKVPKIADQNGHNCRCDDQSPWNGRHHIAAAKSELIKNLLQTYLISVSLYCCPTITREEEEYDYNGLDTSYQRPLLRAR